VNTNFYFAYGSNMDPDQMADRCPAAVPVGVGLLDGWNIVINDRGVATIVRDFIGSIVEGVVWRVTGRCLESLDLYEGVAKGLYSREMLPIRHRSQAVRSIVYLGSSSERGRPREGYLERILGGAAHFGLSETYRRRLESLSGGAPTFGQIGHSGDG
jgi:hypothetical protein